MCFLLSLEAQYVQSNTYELLNCSERQESQDTRLMGPKYFLTEGVTA